MITTPPKLSVSRAIKIHETAIQYHEGRAEHHKLILKRLRDADARVKFPDEGLDKLLDDIDPAAKPTSEQLQSALDAAAEGVEGAETY